MNKIAGVILLATMFTGAGLFSEAQAQFGDIPSFPGMPQFTSVSGHYVNTDVGVEIDFPAGWSGNEIPVENGIVVTVSPAGATASGQMPTTMVLSATQKEEQSPPSDPSTGEMPCTVVSTGMIQVSGVQALESVAECNVNGQVLKAKTVVVNTSARWIVTSLIATSTQYDANVASFNTSVQTLKVNGAINIEGIEQIVEETVQEVIEEVQEVIEETPEATVAVELSPEVATVMVAGQAVQIDFASSSSISNVSIDEETKTLSFTVEGEDGTEGMTEIVIGSVLEGPYAVTIDGVSTSNFETTTNASGQAVIRVMYTHSVHEISVTGTTVVPEFGVIAALVLAVSLVAVVGFARVKGSSFGLGRL